MNTRNGSFESVRRAPVVDQITDALKAKIATDFKAGERLPSMRELCRQFDVSINTVQTAIATLAREGAVQKRPGSGVYVTGRKEQRRIGILSELNLFDSRISPYWRSLAGAVGTRLEAAGYVPQLYIGNAEPGPGASDEPTCPQFWEDAAAGRLDCAVILDVPWTGAWFRRVKACPIPVVTAMTGFHVLPDFAGIVDAAIRRLAARGCHNIGLLGWHNGDIFRKAVAAHRLATRDAWIRTEIHPALLGTGWEEFRDIWRSDERPDALVILDDMLYADAQLAIMDLGVRVPQDLQLAVLTIRNASSPIRLPAVTFEIDPAEAAAQYAATVVSLLRGEPPAPAKPISWREQAVEGGNGASVKTAAEAVAREVAMAEQR